MNTIMKTIGAGALAASIQINTAQANDDLQISGMIHPIVEITQKDGKTNYKLPKAQLHLHIPFSNSCKAVLRTKINNADHTNLNGTKIIWPHTAMVECKNLWQETTFLKDTTISAGLFPAPEIGEYTRTRNIGGFPMATFNEIQRSPLHTP